MTDKDSNKIIRHYKDILPNDVNDEIKERIKEIEQEQEQERKETVNKINEVVERTDFIGLYKLHSAQ